MDVIFGACRCGAIKFEIDPPTRFCAHCHCESCRRSHGAPVVTWVGTYGDRIRVVAGQSVLARYSSDSGATRSFCSVCGSMLFFESPRRPGEVHVARAQILGAIDRAPAAHVYYEERVVWFPFHDELTKLDTL